MSDKHFVGFDLTGFVDNGEQKPISRVTLLLDDENVLTAGDDSGMELLADCPHATQAMVNSILASVKGKTYKMFTAEKARLDPAAELGDGVTAGRVYSVLSRLQDDGNIFPGITAPGKPELEDEYPAGGPLTQDFNRKVSETRSQIKKTADEILLEVKRVENDLEKFGTEFRVSLDGVSARVTDAEGNISNLQQTASSIQSSIKDINENVSSIEQTVDNISLKVKGGLGDEASIILTVGDNVYDEDLDLSNVRQSFANDNSSITISAGRVTFNTGTFVLNGNNVSIDKDGNFSTTGGIIAESTITGSSFITEGEISGITIKGGSNRIYCLNDYVGYIGANFLRGKDNEIHSGAGFNIGSNCYFISFGADANFAKDPDDKNVNYLPFITYANKDSGYLLSLGEQWFTKGFIHFDKDSIFRNKLTFGLSAKNPYCEMYYNERNYTSPTSGERGITISAPGFICLDADYIIRMNGSIISYGTGSIVSDSDVRLKTNIAESDIDALSVINSINTYSFDWIESGEHRDLGFISQQLEEEVSGDFIQHDEGDDVYRVKEMFLIPYLVKSIQQLYNMIVPTSAVMKSRQKRWTDPYSKLEKEAYIAKQAEIRRQEETFVPPEPVYLNQGVIDDETEE